MIDIHIMIYIKEEYLGDHVVKIIAEGILDCESIPVVDKVCQRHLKQKREVRLCLQGLVHISREGRDFLKKLDKGKRIVTGDSPLLILPE